MDPATPLIEFSGVSKSFGANRVLENLNLIIREGDITAILGKSGIGKSVLLKHIAGLLEPDQGEVLYRGQSISDMSRKQLRAIRREFSYVFQHNALLDSLNIFDNVALPLRERREMGEYEIQDNVWAMLEHMELAEFASRHPAQLSGGMNKRVALARALVTEPKVVLFDEPTTGLDPIRKNAILRMISDYQKGFGFTAVLISHDVPDIFFISNRIAILHNGRIIFQGRPLELELKKHPVILDFVHSMANFRDQLIGLTSKRTFAKRYRIELGTQHLGETFCLALFSVKNLSQVVRQTGQIAIQVLAQDLSKILERHLGGESFSVRHSAAEILTVIPSIDMDRCGDIFEGIVRETREAIPTFLRHLPPQHPDIHIEAGLAEGRPGDNLETLLEEARSNTRPLVDIPAASTSPLAP